jgi:predicted nucleic acid-binding protein
LTLESFSNSSDGRNNKFEFVEIGPRELKCHINIIMSIVFKYSHKWENRLSLHTTDEIYFMPLVLNEARNVSKNILRQQTESYFNL